MPMKHLFATIAMIMAGMILSPAVARVYHSTPHTFVQPNGDSVSVRLFGNDFYIDAESEDGYTLIRDDESGYICYAMLSADGREYASSGIRYTGGKAPEGISLVVDRHVRISADRRDEIIADNERLLGRDHASGPMLRASNVLPDTVYGVCLMIDFADRKFSVSREEVDIFLNSSTQTVYGNARSIKEYFRWISGGKLTYINYLPRDIYHAPYKFEYYSPSDATDYTTDRFMPVVTEALLAITREKDGFDLNDISLDGPKIRAINIFYAGESPSNWATGLWPHMGGYNFNLTKKYKISSREWHSYQMSNLDKELSMGTFVHENGHMVLNMPDFYSYEEGNDDNNIKDFNIANTFWTPDDKNPECINPYSLDELGWLSNKQNITNIRDGRVVTLEKGVGNVAVYYGVGANANERYYLEVRDAHYKNYYATKNQGIMIWHVNTNGDNNHAGKPELLDGRPASEDNCMWNSKTGSVFSDESNPSAKWYDGNNSGIYLWDFSAPGSTMTFRCGELKNDPLVFETTSLPQGMIGDNYECKIEVSGGVPDYLFYLKTGELPQGLTLGYDGTISGVPTEAYDGRFTIGIRDVDFSVIEQEYTMKIRKIETVGVYNTDAIVDVSDGYASVTIDDYFDEIAEKLGLSYSDFMSKMGADVGLYAVESNGNIVKTFTANTGYWYDKDGNVDNWTSSTKTAFIYAEMCPDNNGICVGQYPGNTKVGDKCSMTLAFVYGDAQVLYTINVTVSERVETGVDEPLASATEDGDIRVYNEMGQYLGTYATISEIENSVIKHGVLVLKRRGKVFKFVR